MNIPALYDLMVSRTGADGVIRFPSWSDIARAAEVDPLDDAAAVRALIQHGAIVRRPLANTWGDYAYLLVRPAPELRDAFRASLRATGGVWRDSV